MIICVYFAQLLFVLEQLQAITSVKAETPHEQWFQKVFGELPDDEISPYVCVLQANGCFLIVQASIYAAQLTRCKIRKILENRKTRGRSSKYCSASFNEERRRDLRIR